MFQYQRERPGLHELMQELRALVDAYPDRLLVGETDQISYYGDGSNELHMAFNFPLMRTDRLTPAWVRVNQRERLAALPPGAWPCNTLGNHDAPRVYSNYGDGAASLPEVALAVFDLLGRKVRTLVSGPLEAGSYELVWDGTDEMGREVSSGVYVARLKGKGFVAARKMVLAR